jgi:hypothetical protein
MDTANSVGNCVLHDVSQWANDAPIMIAFVLIPVLGIMNLVCSMVVCTVSTNTNIADAETRASPAAEGLFIPEQLKSPVHSVNTVFVARLASTPIYIQISSS